MTRSAPLYGWYSDDFTGATDTLATLAEGGQRALLFLGIPTEQQLTEAGTLDAVGIAGASRTMSPAEMAIELDAAGRFFASLNVGLLHYKCCSTFDSAPNIGSIGAAIAALRPHVQPGPVPIIGGQPNLGRYCIFGNLFAAAGSNGVVHRIDRHPTMSVHPVTPMREADLRRHLAKQGLDDVRLIDFRAYGDTFGPDWAGNAGAEAVLLDVSCVEDLPAIGGLLTVLSEDGPRLVVGASSVAQAFTGACGAHTPAPVLPDGAGAGPILVLVGSLSPVTRAQVAAASGYAMIMIDSARLLTDPNYRETLRRDVMGRLGLGDVMLITDCPAGAPENPAEVATSTAALLRSVVEEAYLSRLIVAGGDTSSRAIQALDIRALSFQAACVTGAPRCRAHSAAPSFNGLSIILKGGQIGPVDFFNVAARL